MPASIGLEFGDTTLRAVILDRQGSAIRLRNATHAVLPPTQTPDEVVVALQQLRRTLPITDPVVLGLPTRYAMISTVQPLIVSRPRARLAMQFELQQQLPYDIDQAVWHYQWLNGSVPPRFAVVAALKRTLVDERIALCQRAGIRVAAVQINGVAAANAWLWQMNKPEASGMLLHVDRTLLEWIVVGGSTLQVIPTLLPPEAMMPVPAKRASTAVAAAGSQASSSSDVELLPQDALRELLKGAWDSLGEWLTTPISRTVWIFGDAATAPSIMDALKQVVGPAIERLSLGRITNMQAAGRNPLEWISACGLALQGLGVAKLPIDLVARLSQLRRAASFQRLAMLAAVCFSLAAVGFAGMAMATRQAIQRERLEGLRKQEGLYESVRPEVKRLLQRQEQLEHRLQQLQTIGKLRITVIGALQTLTDSLPDEIWLTKVELIKTGSLDGVVEGFSRTFEGVTKLVERLKLALPGATVKPLGTTVTVDPASGKELIAFTVQLQQPLEPPKPEAAAAEPQAAAPAAKSTKSKSGAKSGGKSGAAAKKSSAKGRDGEADR